MSLFLGIDLGTSYFKVGLFDERGGLRGLGRVAVGKVSPVPRWYELSEPVFWERLRQGLNQALQQAGARSTDIVALSYSSQANTFLLLDAQDQPLTPLVFWNDARADPVDPSVRSFGARADFSAHTGFLGLSSGFMVAKCHWFQRERPAVWAQTRAIMTIADYFTFALTGQPVGDGSTAAFTGLYDLRASQWWPEAREYFGLDQIRMSRPLRPGSLAGKTTRGAMERLGLPPGLPLAVGGLDHHLAALGSGIGRFADLSISTGTVLAALQLVRQPDPCPGCFHGPHVEPNEFYRLAFDARGAGQLEEFQAGQSPGSTIEELLAAAGLAPARGRAVHDTAWVGQPSSLGRDVRHILERIAASHRRLVRQVSGGHGVQRVVATGGGARSPLWLQIKADMLGVTIVVPATAERACLGAAMLAAVAFGAHPTVAAASEAMLRVEREIKPTASEVAAYTAWADA